MKVLLVSASARISEQVVSALARPDLEIVEVASPQPALRLLDDPGDFDVVVADNDTHPAGGFYLSRELWSRRTMRLHAPLVVLLLAREQDVWLANWSHADAYVLKPIDPFDLAETVEAAARGGPPPALPGVGGAPVVPVPGLEPGDADPPAAPDGEVA